jgi:hypothetical protein
MPARVLFVTHTAEWIGPNISLLELLIRLPDDLRAVVAVPGSGRFTRSLEEHGVPILSFRRLDKYRIPALVSTIRREEISLVYGNSAHSVSRNALVAARLCGIPFVYHLREIARADQRHRVRRLFSWADAAVAVSRATAEGYPRTGSSWTGWPAAVRWHPSSGPMKRRRSSSRWETCPNGRGSGVPLRCCGSCFRPFPSVAS